MIPVKVKEKKTSKRFGVSRIEKYKCSICHVVMTHISLKTMSLQNGTLARICKECNTPTIREELNEYFNKTSFRVLTLDS